MDECSMTSHWKVKVVSIRIKDYALNVAYFVYVVEAFITLNWKAWYNYTIPFSSMPLVCIHFYFILFLFYVVKLSYVRGFNLIVIHAHH